jgi:hypothetical protein
MVEAKKPSQRSSKTAPGIHVDDKFLYEHLRDTRAEMSWRRELEFRYMQFMLVFYPVIGTVMVALYDAKIDPYAFSVTAVGAIVLLLYATIVITKRIGREHKIYIELSEQLVNVWTYFGLFEQGAYIKDKAFLSEDLKDEKTGIGRGLGFRRTQELIWITSSTVIILLVILAVSTLV